MTKGMRYLTLYDADTPAEVSFSGRFWPMTHQPPSAPSLFTPHSSDDATDAFGHSSSIRSVILLVAEVWFAGIKGKCMTEDHDREKVPFLPLLHDADAGSPFRLITYGPGRNETNGRCLLKSSRRKKSCIVICIHTYVSHNTIIIATVNPVSRLGNLEHIFLLLLFPHTPSSTAPACFDRNYQITRDTLPRLETLSTWYPTFCSADTYRRLDEIRFGRICHRGDSSSVACRGGI